MNARSSLPVKAILHIALIVLLAALTLLPTDRSAAQEEAEAVINPRFGLVNAFEAPQAAYEAGTGWELIRFRWDELQPNGPGEWNTSPETEEWLSSARAAGREVVGVLVGTPAWATDGEPGTGVPRGLDLPASDAGNLWAGFVRQVVSYYGARGINRWVIWEDPDIQAGLPGYQWEGGVRDYYRLVKVAYVAAREANPSALIHLGGVSYADPGWFRQFLDVAVNDPEAPANDFYFDVATVHVFNSPEQVYTLTANHYFLMSQWGIPLKPVWINETNARPAVDPAVYPEETAFGQHPNITLEQQAAFIVQAYALGFAAGADRIAVYRTVDNLPEDDHQAFGLLRADGTPRPAYEAYRLISQEANGFVFARRVDEEAHPLIDYVRLTFPTRVTHIAWARTEQTATLVIPARSEQATLVTLEGERWTVEPEGGVYRLVVGGADCNDPVEGCLIGGVPWFLIEEGLEDPLNEVPPSVRVEAGGTLPTPDPGIAMTATAQAAPSATPTPLPTETPEPSPLPPTATAMPEPTGVPESAETAAEATPAMVAEAVEEPPDGNPEEGQPLSPEELARAIEREVRPRGLPALLPYLLMGLGTLVLVGGTWYFFSGPGQPVEEREEAPDDEPREHGPEPEKAVTDLPDEEEES